MSDSTLVELGKSLMSSDDMFLKIVGVTVVLAVVVPLAYRKIQKARGL